MIQPLIRPVLVGSLVLLLGGCSAAAKRSTSTSATSKAASNPFLASAGKVQQDLTQTQTDLTGLESEVKLSK